MMDSGDDKMSGDFVSDLTALMGTLAIDGDEDQGDVASDGSGSSKGSSHGASDKENVNVNADVNGADNAEMKVSEEDKKDTDPESMFLKIAPRIEQRIIDVAKVE